LEDSVSCRGQQVEQLRMDPFILFTHGEFIVAHNR
jgi:hypothetical protein